jgi:transposase
VKMTDAQSQDTVAEVVLGVDTHLDFHVAVALDELGRRLGELTVPTTAKGYQSLVSWAERFGRVRNAGLEGTGSYGAGLAQHLRAKGVEVLEVERPKRRHLRRKGKSPTRSTRRPRPGRSWPARRPESPRAATVRWSRSAP